MMYGSQNMKYGIQNFLSFWAIFCSFTLKNLENQNLEKMKERPGDIYHILHKYPKNNDYMLYMPLRYGT